MCVPSFPSGTNSRLHPRPHSAGFPIFLRDLLSSLIVFLLNFQLAGPLSRRAMCKQTDKDFLP